MTYPRPVRTARSVELGGLHRAMTSGAVAPGRTGHADSESSGELSTTQAVVYDRALAVRRVVAILGDDSWVASHAADLAERCRARLSLIQTWSVPLALLGLGSPAVIARPEFSRECALEECASAADQRVRKVVRELGSRLPVEFQCRRGSVSTITFREIRAAAHGTVILSDCVLARIADGALRRDSRVMALRR
jgi:hypothetical protein